MPLEVTEDTDVSELFAVAVSVQGEQEGPLQTHEAPHAGQVETLRVSQGCGRKKHTEINIQHSAGLTFTFVLVSNCS